MAKSISLFGSLVPAIDFVSRAASKDITRLYLNFIHVESPHIVVATDEKRLHYLDSEDLPNWEPGTYSFVKDRKAAFLVPIQEDVGTFPDWKKVVPKKTPIDSNENVSYDFSQKGYGFDTDVYRFFRDRGLCILFSYLKDIAFAGPVKAYTTDNKHAAFFVSESKNTFGASAIIMPFDPVYKKKAF